jgi:ABC-2 type transport system permease protein
MLKRNLKGAYTIWYRDVIRFVRDRTRIVATLAQPFLYLFVFGTGLGSAMSGSGSAVGAIDFRQFMFPGTLAMTVLFTAVFSAISIVWDREFGFLKEVMVAPVSRTAVALGKVAGGATVAMFQGVVALLFAPIVGVSLSAGQIVSIVGLMLLLATVMTSLGILIAARQKTMEGFQMMMNFLLMPMFFLSGAFFPLRGVPLWMSWLSTVDPVTYGVDSLRQVVLRRSVAPGILAALTVHPVATNVVVMCLLSLAFIVPAVWQFGRQE